MGIERFFSSLNKNFNVVEDLKIPYQPIDSTHFFIDFNSIIHNVSSQMISQINLYKQGKIDSLKFEMKNIDDFEDVLILEVEKSIINLLSQNLIPENLNYLMIAIDGVPTFAKIMEQKKRRYIGDLLSQLMKKFELPFEWSKINISPGTEFMNKMSKMLNNKTFFEKCKEVCVNLRQVLVSDVYNPGEGEMKIMDCLYEINYSDDYKITVYSPDSDMILLLMILKFPVTLLRYDQQKSTIEKEPIFNQINVDKFKKVLFDYCNERIELVDKKLIIDEIVYIFTLFGDDFIPKTESINVGEDINFIIDNYLLTLKDKGNIITIKNKNYTINYENLYYFFNKISKDEIEDLNRYFYTSKFKNFKWAKDKNFNFDLFNISNELKNSADKNEISNKIKNSKHSKDPFFNFIYNCKKIIDGFKLYNFNKNNTKHKNYNMIKKYKSLYYLNISDNDLIDDLLQYCILNNYEFPFYFYQPENNKNYENFINRSFEKKFHLSKMKKLELFNPGNESEELEYLIQNKLDKFYNLFNPINFFYRTKVTTTSNYYNIMFPNKDKNKIIEKYIQGFEWVLNYYFNRKTDYLWHYPYSRTPLLSDVINFNKKVEELDFQKNYIFSPLELIIYITPIDSFSKLNFLPDFISNQTKKDIFKFIEDNLFMFINLKEIYILLNSNPESLTDLFDCSVSLFLSKCHYKLLEKDIDPILYLNKFRKIIPEKNQQMFNNFDLNCKKINS